MTKIDEMILLLSDVKYLYVLYVPLLKFG